MIGNPLIGNIFRDKSSPIFLGGIKRDDKFYKSLNNQDEFWNERLDPILNTLQSSKNVQKIKDLIIRRVYEIYKIHIPPQDSVPILNLIETIYSWKVRDDMALKFEVTVGHLRRALDGEAWKPYNPNIDLSKGRGDMVKDLDSFVNTINLLVVDEAMKSISGNILKVQKYYKELNMTHAERMRLINMNKDTYPVNRREKAKINGKDHVYAKTNWLKPKPRFGNKKFGYPFNSYLE
jgi:hypothetical protein